MNYSKPFDLSVLGEGNRTVDILRKAGKDDYLLDRIEFRFANSNPTREEILFWIDHSSKEILYGARLDEHGDPIRTRLYRVFARVTGTIYEDVEANDPEEARKLLEETVFSSGEPFITMDRDDAETIVPVMYSENGADGSEIEYAPSEKNRQEFANALVGNHPLVLVRSVRTSGVRDAVSARMFLTWEEAYGCMEKEFRRHYGKDPGKVIGKSECPIPDSNHCWVRYTDGSEMLWNIVHATFKAD